MHARAHGQGGGQALSECCSERKSLPPPLPLRRCGFPPALPVGGRAFPQAEPKLGRLVERQKLGERPRDLDGWDDGADRKSTRLNSSHGYISYAVFCLKKKKQTLSPTR